VSAVGLSASLLLVLGVGAAFASDLRCPDPSRMVLIATGPFWMGSDEGERDRARSLSSEAVRDARWFDAELGRRRVTLPAYCLGRYLVTQRDYAAFVHATGRTPPGITRAEYEAQGFRVHDYEGTWTRFLWRGNRPPAGWEEHPVVLFQWTATASGARGQQVVKGCAWDDEAGLCRPAFRHTRPATSRHILIGFRCAGVPS